MITNDIVISNGVYNLQSIIDWNNWTFPADGVHDVIFNEFVGFDLHKFTRFPTNTDNVPTIFY